MSYALLQDCPSFDQFRVHHLFFRISVIRIQVERNEPIADRILPDRVHRRKYVWANSTALASPAVVTTGMSFGLVGAGSAGVACHSGSQTCCCSGAKSAFHRLLSFLSASVAASPTINLRPSRIRATRTVNGRPGLVERGS